MYQGVLVLFRSPCYVLTLFTPSQSLKTNLEWLRIVQCSQLPDRYPLFQVCKYGFIYSAFNSKVFYARAQGHFSRIVFSMIKLYWFVTRYDKLSRMCKQAMIAQDWLYREVQLESCCFEERLMLIVGGEFQQQILNSPKRCMKFAKSRIWASNLKQTYYQTTMTRAESKYNGLISPGVHLGNLKQMLNPTQNRTFWRRENSATT